MRFIRDWEENPFGVYAITADGELVDKSEGNADCIGVALLTNNQSIMIPKEDATDGTNTTLHWSKNLYGKDITALPNSGENAGFNGKDNTNKIIAGYTEHNVEMDSRDMCRVLQNFNATDTFHDWYIPSADQLSEIYAWRVFIKETLNNISGAEFKWSMDYWSSCEGNGDLATSVYFGGGQIFNNNKDSQAKVRFVRDLQ